MNFQLMVDSIKQRKQRGSTLLVGIDGRSGSGKSSLAEKLSKRFGDSQIIHLDTFGMYEGENSSKRVINDVLLPLKNNQLARYRGYEKGHENESYLVESGGISIVEGIFALNADLISYYDYKIWVECPAKLGHERGNARDIQLSGIDNSEKWLNYWMPKEEEYILKQKPQDKADFIVDGSKELNR